MYKQAITHSLSLPFPLCMMNYRHPQSSPIPKPLRNPRDEEGEEPHPFPPIPSYPDLERRTITLADGSVRSYFALPPADHPWALPHSGDRRVLLRENILLYGNPNHVGAAAEVAEKRTVGAASARGPSAPAPKRARRDPKLEEEKEEEGSGLERAFLELTKAISENAAEKNKYLESGKGGPLHCIVCGRDSRRFAGVHDLIMHTYTARKKLDLRIRHLGLHKALCVLMGWDYTLTPETSKAYQSLSADTAAANREDLIVWPPTVIIHNTNTGRKKDGRMAGLNNKDMEERLEELGFTGSMAKSLYSKGGHLGITAVNFATLKEADDLVNYFERDNRGRKGWACLETSHAGDDEKNPALVEIDEKTGERRRIFYGYLATAFDLQKVDIDTRKKATIKSRKELDNLK